MSFTSYYENTAKQAYKRRARWKPSVTLIAGTISISWPSVRETSRGGGKLPPSTRLKPILRIFGWPGPGQFDSPNMPGLMLPPRVFCAIVKLAPAS